MFRQKLNPLLSFYPPLEVIVLPWGISWIGMLFRLPTTKYSSSLVNWEVELKHRWCINRFLQTQLHTYIT